MRWVVAFSRSGSEIYNLSKRLGIKPDLILSNRKDFDGCYYDELDCEYIDNSIESWNNYLQPGDIVTLHGYLRIIPSEICERYNILNGHPGLITEYPELKGFSPQERCAEYPTIGSVIHKVTAGVDEGEILDSKKITNTCKDTEEIYQALSEVSLKLWEEYLKGELCV